MSHGLKWTVWLALGIAAALILFGPYAGLPMAAFIALVVGIVVGAMKLYRQWSNTAQTPGGSALGFALVANGIAVGMTMLTFLPAPTGSYGRPMALTAFYFVFGLVMTPLGIGKAVRVWSHQKPLAISAMILSLAIVPVELLTFFALASAKAFGLEP